MGCDWAGSMHTDTNGQKSEPKVFFANERTMISWLGMAVTLSSISTGNSLIISPTLTLNYTSLIIRKLNPFIPSYTNTTLFSSLPPLYF